MKVKLFAYQTIKNILTWITIDPEFFIFSERGNMKNAYHSAASKDGNRTFIVIQINGPEELSAAIKAEKKAHRNAVRRIVQQGINYLENKQPESVSFKMSRHYRDNFSNFACPEESAKKLSEKMTEGYEVGPTTFHLAVRNLLYRASRELGYEKEEVSVDAGLYAAWQIRRRMTLKRADISSPAPGSASA
jgi:hypothetical protein